MEVPSLAALSCTVILLFSVVIFFSESNKFGFPLATSQLFAHNLR